MVFLFAMELKHINEPHCFFINIIIVTIIMSQSRLHCPAASNTHQSTECLLFHS